MCISYRCRVCHNLSGCGAGGCGVLECVSSVNLGCSCGFKD